MLPPLLACSTPEPPPDVLVVVLDTARADRLHTFGHERDTSYQLDALAESGVVFEQAYTAGTWTWPGHAELFTGEPPWVSGARYAPPGGTSWVSPLDADLPTLATRMEAAGYDTVARSTNKLLHPDLGMMRGFGQATTHRTDGDTVEAARATISEDRDKPLFLFVNVLVAHTPYFVVDGVPWSGQHRARITSAEGDPLASMRTEIDGALAVDAAQDCGGRKCAFAWSDGEIELTDELTVLTDLYDGGLVQADNALRALVQSWTGSGRQGVVIVTSDHGEFLGEHRMLLHQYVTHPAVLHVPLLVIAPGYTPGQRHAAPVGLGDVYDSVLALAGAPTGGWTLADGLAGTPRPEPIQAAAWPDPSVATPQIAAEPWRFHHDGTAWVALRGEAVMDGDPALAEMARSIPLERDAAALDSSVQDALKALGYMD